MTTSSLFSVLDLLGTPPHTIPSPAASSAISCERKKAAEVTITTPNWALESPGKASKRPWNVVVGTSTNPSTPKKRRNAALISTILSCDQSPLAGKSDESMASFLEETVCDEPSPVQPAPCSKSMPSSQNVYTAVGVDDILNKAMKQLDSKGTQPVPELSTSYVTPHVVDKTQPRMQSPIKAGREVSFRTKVIQQFSHGGWRSVAPKLSDKGSYTYTHDKLNDSVRFTRDELLSYANDHDIFRNPALMDPHMVMRVIKHGGQHQRKAPKSFKHRPSSEWSPIIV
ncbi:hypothetical protein DYB32_002459 [Aphanomyces invadans]|uniref:Uncharacterized protein n=1 Tax=Aphanomyces invadans TaxID=157072 RepID=A0A418B3C9_9STRA|nr:hypothetical protein DYB32_002459 [Aphanomyces invadans]